MSDVAELHKSRDRERERHPARQAVISHAYGANTTEPPTTYNDRYTEEDKVAVARLYRWLNQGANHLPGHAQQRTRAKLARMGNMSISTVSAILTGTYNAPPGKHLKKLLQAIDRAERRQREVIRLPWVDTLISRQIYTICHRAHMMRDIGLVCGRPGTGKTATLKRYAEEVESAILLEASPNMSTSVLLDELIDRTNAQVRTSRSGSRGTQASRERAVREALSGTDALIIIDEADSLTERSLNTLRRIMDQSEIGVVLAGEPRLHEMMRHRDGRFGRVHSRVGFWPEIFWAISEQDCEALIVAAHECDQVELTPEVLDAYWQVSEGSVRTLSKIVPNVRDFGLKQGHKLTPKLIFEVAQKTMGIEKGGRRV